MLPGPVWNYHEHFDAEADKAAFMESAAKWKEEHEREVQRDWRAETRRRAQAQRTDAPVAPDERVAKIDAMRKQGFSDLWIATTLGISTRTVRNLCGPRTDQTAKANTAKRCQELRAEGLSWREIGKRVGVRHETAHRLAEAA